MTKTAEDRTLDQLADAAIVSAAEGARQMLDANNMKLDGYGLLTEYLREEVKASIGEALDDAKAAIEAGRASWAEPTFRATMKAAGVRAAKRTIEDSLTR